jgi:hypothetical protein
MHALTRTSPETQEIPHEEDDRPKVGRPQRTQAQLYVVRSMGAGQGFGVIEGGT